MTTLALVPVTKQTFSEIKQMLEAAGYPLTYREGKLVLPMDGLALIEDDGKMFNVMRNQGLALKELDE